MKHWMSENFVFNAGKIKGIDLINNIYKNDDLYNSDYIISPRILLRLRFSLIPHLRLHLVPRLLLHRRRRIPLIEKDLLCWLEKGFDI